MMSTSESWVLVMRKTAGLPALGPRTRNPCQAGQLPHGTISGKNGSGHEMRGIWYRVVHRGDSSV